MAQEKPPFPKVMCIGLDGATFDVIDPLLKRGRLPTLAGLLATGTRASLRSTVPPLSAPAWVSFMTGVNPGKHGVFHFRSMTRGALGSELMGSWAYRGRTIFDHASRNDLRVIAFRVPMSYPPWPVNGIMVSGFPTPDPKTNFSMPQEVGEGLPPMVKLAPLKSMVASVEAQIDNFEHYLERSTETLVQMLRENEFDLFCYVNSITDWVAHKFWRYSDPTAPGFEAYPVGDGTLLDHFYERADESLGKLLEAVDDPGLVIVMSDHGTGPRSPLRFNANAWLEELGLQVAAGSRPWRRPAAAALEWGKDVLPKKYWLWQHAPKAVRSSAQRIQANERSIEWSRSRAYAVAIDHHVLGVNVNLAGRERLGSVPVAQFEAIRQQVIDAAKEFTDPVTGEPVIRAAHRREDLYSGIHTEAAPDVVLELNESREAGHAGGKRSLSTITTRRRERSSASHRPDGILVMNGGSVRQANDLGRAHLLDVPATIVWALGLELPDDMDGSVLTEAFEPEFAARYPRRTGTRVVDGSEDEAYTQEEEEQMTEHLRDLGYV